MDSKQKYIEVDPLYEIDDWFFYKLGELTSDRKMDIIAAVASCVPNLPSNNEYIQAIAGVVKGDDPIFFEIEFYKHTDGCVSLRDINQLNSDEYLDYIIENCTIKSYGIHGK